MTEPAPPPALSAPQLQAIMLAATKEVRESHPHLPRIEALDRDIERMEREPLDVGEVARAVMSAAFRRAATAWPSPLLLAARAVMAVRPSNWDDAEDPEQVAAWSALEAALTPGPDELACGICTLGFVEGDPCLNDVDLGPVHAACCGPERESYVGPDGEPLKDGELLPTPWLWTADHHHV